MTFDDARRYLIDHLEDMNLVEVIGILSDIREEYAPTVEMTQRQYDSFERWKYHTAGWNMTNCAEWAEDENMTASNAMRAWLHPESIKVTNEEQV